MSMDAVQLPAVWIKFYICASSEYTRWRAALCMYGGGWHVSGSEYVVVFGRESDKAMWCMHNWECKQWIHNRVYIAKQCLNILSPVYNSWWSVCKAGAREGRASHTYSNHILHLPCPPHDPSIHRDRGRGQGYDPRAQISGGNDPLRQEWTSRRAKRLQLASLNWPLQPLMTPNHVLYICQSKYKYTCTNTNTSGNLNPNPHAKWLQLALPLPSTRLSTL